MHQAELKKTKSEQPKRTFNQFLSRIKGCSVDEFELIFNSSAGEFELLKRGDMLPTKQDYHNALQLAELAYLTDMDALIIQHVKRQFLAGEVVQKNLYGAFKLICQHYFGSSE